MLKIKNLTKYYNKILGVKDISLEVNDGEIFGFIGPNGAGKSTTIKCILSLINKTAGKIFINNEEVTKNNYQIKKNIGYLPSEINLYENMKVSELINYNKKFYDIDLTKRVTYLIDKLKIETNKKISELSFGNLKKVGILLALMHNPKLLILDEPTNGLDPLMQETFYELLKEEQAKGTTIFFSSHNLSEVKKLCDRVAIIKNGKILSIKTIKEMQEELNFVKVKIISDEYKKLAIPIKTIKIIKENHNSIEFFYQGNINDLINDLNKINIIHLDITEPDLENMFIEYYKKGDKND